MGYEESDAPTRTTTSEELATLVASRESITIIDVREPHERASGVIEGAVLLPRGLVEAHVEKHVPSKAARVAIVCESGSRSSLVVDALVRLGYEAAQSLEGGMSGWRSRRLPTRRPPIERDPKRLSWADVRREFAIVARRVPVLGAGERPLVYLDHAASTHAPESVLSAYVQFIEHEYANVHRGTHLLSRKATERFDEAYAIVADYLGAELSHGCVTFTSNTTHAIDLVSHVMHHHPGRVVTTEMEHHSNELTHRSRGEVLRARVNDVGELDLEHLEELLRAHRVKLVAVTAGSNVTGLTPDLGAIARLAHRHGALVMADAAQALARMPIDVKAPDDPEHLDFVVGAGHKAYAPFGAGFVYGPRKLMSEAPPHVAGGGTASQVGPESVTFLDAPDRHQGGTPNVGGVVGLARALTFLRSIGLDEVRAHELALTRRVMEGMRALGGVHVYGPPEPEKRLGVVSFNVEGISDLMTAAVLSEEGALAVRNGRFCAHIYVDRLIRDHHARVGGEVPRGAVRASVGLYNDESDVDRLLEHVARVRDRAWVGKYRTKGDSVSAEFAGRCADRWMEATDEPVGDDPGIDAHGYGI